jgi:lipoprotein-anchoring transpeptidase ErfK/SrfK
MGDKATLGAAAMAAVLYTGTAAQADPRFSSTSQSNLGGGFIEFMVTGRSGPRHQQAVPVPSVRHEAYAPAGTPMHQYYSPGQSLPIEPQPATRAPGIPQHAALNPDFRQVERSLDPMYLPQVVAYGGNHRPGTIVIDTPNKFLYLVEADGKARRYGIGVGRPGFEWAGVKAITRKAEWPDWRPPAAMLQRRPDLPRYMPGGPENPMGARGLYLGSSLYRIHGTNEPHTIGQAVSSGCIRMRNEDVTDLYERVRVGTRVIVM